MELRFGDGSVMFVLVVGATVGVFCGEFIGSVDVVDGVNDVVDADGDVFGLENKTPSNKIPFTSNFTTNCGSPVAELSRKSK